MRASIAMSIADFGVEIEVQERPSLWCDRIRAEKLGGDARLIFESSFAEIELS